MSRVGRNDYHRTLVVEQLRDCFLGGSRCRKAAIEDESVGREWHSDEREGPARRAQDGVARHAEGNDEERNGKEGNGKKGNGESEEALTCYFRPMTDTVGFIGLGVMGRPMALNLRKRQTSLIVHNRSAGPVDELVAAGAERADSPADVARKSTRIITMLPDGPDVERVLTGDNGVFSNIQPGTVVVDMSTIAPATARRLAEIATGRGAFMLDAPVSGGEIGAIDGTLSIMVGGDVDALEKVRPILEGMGNPERIVHIGPAGAGQICKACNQLVIGGTLAAVGEAFALARKSGVDPAKVRTALLGGFAASRVLEVHGERLLKENFKPGFPARLYRKDLRIVMDALNDAQAPAPVTAIVQQLLTALIAEGKEALDYSALGTVLAGLARVEKS